MQYNNGIPQDSRYAVHADFFKQRLAELHSPEGQQQIEKVKVLTELAEKGATSNIHPFALPPFRPYGPSYCVYLAHADGYRYPCIC